MSTPLPSDPALGLNYRPTLPRRKDWRIGCVGAGFIMRDCHLMAYRNAGFNPVAIASRNSETAREVAAWHRVPKVHDAVTGLLADESIEILDVAVPPNAQPDLIRRAVELGEGRLRGILAQKPLALSLSEARDLVEVCADAGIVLAVNQNMRFDQSVRAAKDILDRGWIREPVFGEHRHAGDSALDAVGRRAAESLDVRDVDPSPRQDSAVYPYYGNVKEHAVSLAFESG